MIKNWLTFGMSPFDTKGLQDTSRLMTRAFEGKTVYIEPVQSIRNIRSPETSLFDSEPRLYRTNHLILRPPLSIPKKLDFFHFGTRIQAKRLMKELEHFWGKDWRDETNVYVTNWTPESDRMILELNPRYLIFDCVDDVLSFPYSWNRQETIASWKRLAKQASVVIAVSETLRIQMESELGVPVTYAPNGVDAQLFMNGHEIPEVLVPFQEKRCVGFAGSLNHWIDFISLLKLAEENEDVCFFVMGRKGTIVDKPQKQSFDELLTRPNVHDLGQISYDELPQYLSQMDVLIIPRIPSASSEASNPLKLFEYLAIGKPIVIGGVPIPTELDALVYSIAQRGTYQNALEWALSEQSIDMESRRRNYARTHTWQVRIGKILQHVKNDTHLASVSTEYPRVEKSLYGL